MSERRPPTPYEDFTDATSIIPEVVADRVIETLGLAVGDIGKRWFSDHVSIRTRYLHANNKDWRKWLEAKDDSGRDQLYIFVAHWAGAFVLDKDEYMRKHPHDGCMSPREGEG